MVDQELAVRNKQEVNREEPTRPGRAYQPDVDIYETSNALWLWADMPGVDEKNINIDLANGVLTIEGVVVLQDYKELAPAYTEYNVGHYSRSFRLSSRIDQSRIGAELGDGVLSLTLPKVEEAKPRAIQVK